MKGVKPMVSSQLLGWPACVQVERSFVLVGSIGCCTSAHAGFETLERNLFSEKLP